MNASFNSCFVRRILYNGDNIVVVISKKNLVYLHTYNRLNLWIGISFAFVFFFIIWNFKLIYTIPDHFVPTFAFINRVEIAVFFMKYLMITPNDYNDSNSTKKCHKIFLLRLFDNETSEFIDFRFDMAKCSEI